MIGTGHGHAASKLKALRAMPEYEFVAMGESGAPEYDGPERDPRPFQAERFVPARELIEDRSIQFIALESSEPDVNLAFAEQCVAAGKFVHLDKPPGSDFARFRRLLEEARRKGVVVQQGYQWRYHGGMQTALDAARQGWLGRVYRFRAGIDKLIGREERKHLASYPGGMMFSEGCHLIDRAVALLGKPHRITGYLRHEGLADDGLRDNNLAVLEYPGALAEITMAGFDHGGVKRRWLELYGTNGSARLQSYARPKLTIDLREAAGPYPKGETMLEPRDPPGLPYTPDFAEMAAIIRSSAKPTYSVEHDLIAQETLLRACGMFS